MNYLFNYLTRRAIIFFSLISLMLVGALIGAHDVNAISDYDGVIKPSVTQITTAYNFTGSGGQCAINSPQTTDMATTWGGFILNPSNYTNTNSTIRDEFISQFNANLDSGIGWAVTQRTQNNMYSNVGGCDMNVGDKWIEVYVASNPNLVFTDDFGSHQLAMQGTSYIAYIHYSTADASLKVVGVNKGINNMYIQQQALSDQYERPFLINFNIPYPPDYSGQVPPTTAEPPTIVKPEFKLEAKDRTVTVNFRDAAPNKSYVYAWTMLKYSDTGLIADGTVEDSGVNEPESTAEFTVSTRSKYVFGVMMCPIGTQASDETCDAIAGTKAVWVDLDINGSPILIDTGGNLENSDTVDNCETDTLNGTEVTHCTTKSMLQDCFTETFPFMDIPSCLSNLGIITSILSFNVININGRFDSTPCRTMTTIDSWMHLNHPTLCPQVPQIVRDIVTPFVTMALGLMMLKFLTEPNGRERF